jgi:hypothetical protein
MGQYWWGPQAPAGAEMSFPFPGKISHRSRRLENAVFGKKWSQEAKKGYGLKP